MATDLQLQDPVHITTNDNDQLEGIVAHLGPVQFAQGSDWIGVRLTGSSVGKGKNDGSVKGTFYFDAGGEKNGMFVKKENVSKRTLNRLEMLRLRREIAESTSTSSASARTTKIPINSPVRTRLAAPSVATSAAPAKDNRIEEVSVEEGELGISHHERMEKLRARREALAKGREKASVNSDDATSYDVTNSNAQQQKDEEHKCSNESLSVGNSSEQSDATKQFEETKINLSAATPGFRAELSRLQSIISDLKSDLKKKEAENASLQSSLDFMSKGAEQTTHDAVRMYAMGALALTEAKTSSPRSGVKMAQKKSSLTSEGHHSSRSLIAEIDGDNASEEDSEGEDSNEGVIHQAAAAVSQALIQRNDELTAQLSNLTSNNTNLQHQLTEAEERISNLSLRLDQFKEGYQNEKNARIEDQKNFAVENSLMISKFSNLDREYKILQERVSEKSSSQEHSEVTLAKLRAEINSLQRKNEELANSQSEWEATLEELVLDKEQLKEEKEELEDKLEEYKIDLESAQLELEDLKSRSDSSGAHAATLVEDIQGVFTAGEGLSSNDPHDVIRSLTLQNTRLRTAILRLREQSEFDKNAYQRQLKTFQSDFNSKEELEKELKILRSTYATTLVEVQELKDAVDQTTSLEETIETLSDKVWNLEQEKADLEQTIRELEESAEIATEMEEVQNEELKAITKDLDGRDALIRNLEEVIRMQRRREEDFQRYVSEFRGSIAALKQEKAALLALLEGDKGEKTNLLATSQKALAQAAQLAVDNAQARQRELEAVFDRVTARSATYFSQRLETLLPLGIMSAELAAIKGEIYLSKVADKAAVSLSSLEEIFDKAINKGAARVSEFNLLEEESITVLSDVSSQQVNEMVHQTQFASMTIDIASDAALLIAIGQWPDLISPEQSTHLGSIFSHSITQLDSALSEQLKLLKLEGVLSPLRSSLADLDQSIRSTRLALFSATDESGKSLVPSDWKPPYWEVVKKLSLGRFHCLGATAVISSAICPFGDTGDDHPVPTLSKLSSAVRKAKECCSTVYEVCEKVSRLPMNDNEVMELVENQVCQFEAKSTDFFKCVKTTFMQQSVTSEDLNKCTSFLESAFIVVRQLMTLLSKVNLGDQNSTCLHPLSPEFGDTWGGVTNVVSEVISVHGDHDDMNYLFRARTIEQQITDAIQNEPKLTAANVKIANLEKSLMSKSKEIVMQNARISELETLISRTTAISMSPLKGAIPSALSDSSNYTHKLKEEVRVLQEALDVMQQQTDEYEKEIRSLKDKSRTPRGNKQGSSVRVTPKRSTSMEIDASLNQLGRTTGAAKVDSRDLMLESISLETALFRPMLASVTQSSMFWKAKTMMNSLTKLAPLNVHVKPYYRAAERLNRIHFNSNTLLDTGKSFEHRCMEELTLAQNDVRMVRASLIMVDLIRTDTSSRDQLNKLKLSEITANKRLKDAALSCSFREIVPTLPSSFSGTGSQDYETIWGKVTVPCQSETGLITPLVVSKHELLDFHQFLLQ